MALSRRKCLFGLTSATWASTWPGGWAAAASADGAHRIQVAIAARHSLYHLPLVLAYQLGYVRQAGLSIQWLEVESGAHVSQAVLSGRADVGAGAFEHVLGLHGLRQDHRAFVLLGRTPQLALAVQSRWARPLSMGLPIPGLKLGISALHSGSHWAAQYWLLRQGLSAQEVNWLELGVTPSAVIDAFREGRVDAYCGPDPIIHWLEQKHEARVLAEARTLASATRWLGAATPGCCLYASGAWLTRQAAAAQGLSDALVLALKWLRTAGPTDLLRALPMPAGAVDRALFLGAFEKVRESYNTDGNFNDSAVFNAWRSYLHLPSVQGPLNLALESTFTNDFVGRARRRTSA